MEEITVIFVCIGFNEVTEVGTYFKPQVRRMNYWIPLAASSQTGHAKMLVSSADEEILL